MAQRNGLKPGLTRRTLIGAAALAPFAAPAIVRAESISPHDQLKLLLDWYINPNHIPIIVAHATGLFPAHGLNVKIVEPADPNDPPKLVAAGQADIAITYQPQLTMQIDQGLPLARIGVLVDTPLNMLLALGDGPVKTIADLKGKRIGNSVGGFEDALLKTMLGTAGLALSDVELINVNFALAQSLLAGNVDAVIGAYRNYELNILAIEGKAAQPFFVEQYGVPAYDELIFVANRERAASAPMARFLRAIEAGVAATLNDPKAAWEHFIAGRPQLNDELNKRAFADSLPRLAHVPGAADPARYETFSRYLKDQGLIATSRPAADYLVRPSY
jgi:putative hydroxymethylpyrimidine transport system substrate-binding protein